MQKCHSTASETSNTQNIRKFTTQGWVNLCFRPYLTEVSAFPYLVPVVDVGVWQLSSHQFIENNPKCIHIRLKTIWVFILHPNNFWCLYHKRKELVFSSLHCAAPHLPGPKHGLVQSTSARPTLAFRCYWVLIQSECWHESPNSLLHFSLVIPFTPLWHNIITLSRLKRYLATRILMTPQIMPANRALTFFQGKKMKWSCTGDYIMT